MKQGMLVVLCAMVFMTGCGMTSNIKMENGLLIQEAGQTNLFRPSLSVMQVSKCVPEEGITTVIDVDGNSETCYGRFMPIATVQGTQAGSMSGIGSAAIQGGAIVGGAYLLADGIRDSGDETTNNTSSNGGNSNSLSSSRSDAFGQGNSSAAASGGAGGNGYGYGGKGGSGGSVINKSHRR